MFYHLANTGSHGKITRPQGREWKQAKPLDSQAQYAFYHTHSISQGSHRTSQHSKKKNKTTCAWKELGAHIAEGINSKKRDSHFGYLFSVDTMLPLSVMNFLFILPQVYYYVFSVYMNLWKANGDQCWQLQLISKTKSKQKNYKVFRLAPHGVSTKACSAPWMTFKFFQSHLEPFKVVIV